MWLFKMRNDDAFGLMDPCCEKDTDITSIRVICGFPECREGEVCPHLFCHPRCKIRNCCRQSNANGKLHCENRNECPGPVRLKGLTGRVPPLFLYVCTRSITGFALPLSFSPWPDQKQQQLSKLLESGTGSDLTAFMLLLSSYCNGSSW